MKNKQLKLKFKVPIIHLVETCVSLGGDLCPARWTPASTTVNTGIHQAKHRSPLSIVNQAITETTSHYFKFILPKNENISLKNKFLIGIQFYPDILRITKHTMMSIDNYLYLCRNRKKFY